jgi:preprotein translocase subunit YajC
MILNFILLIFNTFFVIFNFIIFKKNKDRKKDSYEVIDLLHDLTSGKAIIEVKRVDPSSVFQRQVRE